VAGSSGGASIGGAAGTNLGGSSGSGAAGSSGGAANGGVAGSGGVANGGVAGSGGVANGGVAGAGGAATGGVAGAGGAANGGVAGAGGVANGGVAGAGIGGAADGGAAGASGSAGASAGGLGGGAGVAGAAGSSSAASPTAVSGTRLKAKYTAGADGSKRYVRNVLFDSLLGVDCAFMIAADSTLRCLPVVPTGWDYVAFSDAACTKREVVVQPPPLGCSADPAPYVITTDAPPVCGEPAGTSPPNHVFPVGAFTGAVNYLYEGPSCQGQGQSGSQIGYALGPEVSASMFVQGTPGYGP
jgi:hypothetical protein